jgi:hypothetical protein
MQFALKYNNEHGSWIINFQFGVDNLCVIAATHMTFLMVRGYKHVHRTWEEKVYVRKMCKEFLKLFLKESPFHLTPVL